VIALDFAVDLDAFDAAFLVRVVVEEGVEDFFRDRVVSFEVFFIVMSALYHTPPDLLVNHNHHLKNVAALMIVVLQ